MAKRTQGRREQKRLQRKRAKSLKRAEQYRLSAERKGGSKSSTPANRPRREEYSHAIADARVAQRRADAQERDEAHAKLPIKAKIAKAQARRGESKREVARLQAILDARLKGANKPLDKKQKA